MAGFFGLFGGKTKYVDEPMDVEEPENKEAYYLESDEAKTLGNIEFMRKPNTIRRTFPKTRSNDKGGESIKQVSSMESAKLKSTDAIPTSVSAESPANDTNQNGRRGNDDNLDRFLKMANEIKK